MKHVALIIFFISLVSTSFAADRELARVEKIAKEMRRELWIANHSDVSSTVTKVDKTTLGEYVRSDVNETYENPLSRDEISSLYSCYHRTNCSLYLIQVSSEYYSGYGSESSFILMNPETLGYEEIRHVTYSE